jgi:hypothetical protein
MDGKLAESKHFTGGVPMYGQLCRESAENGVQDMKGSLLTSEFQLKLLRRIDISNNRWTTVTAIQRCSVPRLTKDTSTNES